MGLGLSRVAVICSADVTDWVSCRSISSNLAASYRIALGKRVKFISCDNWNRPSDITKTARQIHRYSPERIVFLDHTPHPRVLIEPLKSLYGDADLPELFFHIYGDFTRYSRDWADLEKLLVGTKTLFACASLQQMNLVSRVLRRPKSR